VLVVALPISLAVLATGGFLFLLASGQVHPVRPPSGSTAGRPSAYEAAIEDSHGVLHGTHFIVSVPLGWQATQPPVNDTGIEVTLKRAPITRSNPVIIVTVTNAPRR
jgi:hypothetical protein